MPFEKNIVDRIIIKQVELNFNHLPRYAHFLLHNKLKDVSAALLNAAREEKIPFLKYYETLSEKKMVELSVKNTKELLEYFVQNKAKEYISLTLKIWINNQLDYLNIEQITARDITGFAFIRRKIFRTFLSEYTSESAVFIAIMDEVDRFTFALEESSFDTLFRLHDKKMIELTRINNELTSFSYIASHDLKEPLRKIKTYSNFIIEKNKDNLPDTVKDYLSRIIASTGNMQKLIDDLLAFSKTSSTEKILIHFDLNNLLEEVKNSMKYTLEEQNVTIITAPLPVLKIIPFQFQQLLENIIGNAVKYSRPDTNPVITITSGLVAGADYIAEGADANKNYNKLSVADNGIGFEQEYAKKIFEIFQRLHGKNEYSGTGIGLAICKKIVENHHGFITAKSEIGEGAVFNIFIPL